jgi:dihydroorotase
VAIRDGRIAAVEVGEPSSPVELGPARDTLEVSDGVLLPGLVDTHAHPALAGSRYGIDPDQHMLAHGVTTVLSQGDAGALTWSAYREHTIERIRTRVRMALNLSIPGESLSTPSLLDLAAADVDACVDAVAEGGDLIWGIAVYPSELLCGDNDPREVVRRALEAAERSGRPLLYGARRQPDWPLDEQLAYLRPGDVVTYCFHGDDEAVVRDGRVRDCVWQARERGVLFDACHGMESFDFDVAATAVREGFPPDSISTDLHSRHLGSSPQHDLPLMVSKFLAAGLPELEAWRRVTARPAETLGLSQEIGALRPGFCADLTALRWNPGPLTLRDGVGKTRTAGYWQAALTVRDGQVVRPSAG